MANSGTVQLDSEYPHESATEEPADYSSDDSEVSVANLNRQESNSVFAEEEEEEEDNEEDENYSAANAEGEVEIVSDDDYTYSEDSLCSDDSCRDSEVTNITPRSSLTSSASPLNRALSLELPVRRNNMRDFARAGSAASSQERFDNVRDNVRRMCSSVNDNRHSTGNEPRIDAGRARARRRNMSFTNAEMRKIELENQFLLKKIMTQQKPRNNSARVQSVQPRVSSSAINRRKLQRKIEEENMMLLRRIQGAKSCALSTNVVPGFRLTSL